MTDHIDTAQSSIDRASQPVVDQPPYRITTLFSPHPSVSEAEFFDHWYSIHGPLCVPWALRYNIVEYTQYITPKAQRDVLAGGKSSEGGVRGVSGYSACADFYVRDYEDFLRAFQDPYYIEVIRPDEDIFINKGKPLTTADGSIVEPGGAPVSQTRFLTMMGQNRSIIKDGKAMVEVSQRIWDNWHEYQRRAGLPQAEMLGF